MGQLALSVWTEWTLVQLLVMELPIRWHLLGLDLSIIEALEDGQDMESYM